LNVLFLFIFHQLSLPKLCKYSRHYVLLILTLPQWLLESVKYLKSKVKEYKDEQNILNTRPLYVCIKIPVTKKN
jgi:hypothetical protein